MRCAGGLVTPDADVFLLVSLFRIGYCPLRGLLSLALSLEDQYDRITTLPSLYDVSNLYSQSHCMNMPVHP